MAVLVTLFGATLTIQGLHTDRVFTWMLFDGDYPESYGAEAVAYVRFVTGVLGAVMAGWAILLAIVLALGHLAGHRPRRAVPAAGTLVVERGGNIVGRLVCGRHGTVSGGGIPGECGPERVDTGGLCSGPGVHIPFDGIKGPITLRP